MQAEIGNLVRALKSMGDQALVSVQEGLKECESEKRELTEKLGILSDEEKLLAVVTEESERFLDAWRRVREIFSGAGAAVQRELVQSFIEELVWTPADPKGKTGTYRLKFFPEILGDGNGPGNPPEKGDGGDDSSRPEPPHESENAPVLRPVRDLVRKAPRSQPSS